MVRCQIPAIMEVSGSTGKTRHQVTIFWTKLQVEYFFMKYLCRTIKIVAIAGLLTMPFSTARA